MTQPIAIIVAGPNGSGKTTFARSMFCAQPFINADEIASSICPHDVESVARTAGRKLISKVNQLVKDKATFSVETTLAGARYPRDIRKWKDLGYRVVLYYFWIPDPTFAIRRVRTRVKAGGHSIDDDIIVRRYEGGMKNLITCKDIVDNCVIIDNTSSQPEILFRSERT